MVAKAHRGRGRTAKVLLGVAALLAVLAPQALTVPTSVPQIVRNDGTEVRATGRIFSPPSASNCRALLRAQLQVPTYDGWRVVRALGRHRINVCDGESGNWTYGDYTVWFGSTYLLKPGPARLCVQTEQTVNGVPSRHVACKRFHLA